MVTTIWEIFPTGEFEEESTSSSFQLGLARSFVPNIGPVCVHSGALAPGETYSEALVETGGEKVPKV